MYENRHFPFFLCFVEVNCYIKIRNKVKFYFQRFLRYKFTVHIFRDKTEAATQNPAQEKVTEIQSETTNKNETESFTKRLRLNDNSSPDSSVDSTELGKNPPLQPSEYAPIDSYGRVLIDDTDYFGSRKSNKRPFQRSRYVNKLRNEEHYVMAYLCKLKPRPGTLNLEKCVELGVTPGPILGRLKSGKDIELKDGRVVRADDVRSPTDPGAAFIFIDIPTIDYLNSLEACEHFAKYQKTAITDSDMALAVVHFTPQEVIKTRIYQEFMEKFAASTRHIILNERNEFSGCEASHRIQWQLNQLHPHIFPLLK